MLYLYTFSSVSVRPFCTTCHIYFVSQMTYVDSQKKYCKSLEIHPYLQDLISLTSKFSFSTFMFPKPSRVVWIAGLKNCQWKCWSQSWCILDDDGGEFLAPTGAVCVTIVNNNDNDNDSVELTCWCCATRWSCPAPRCASRTTPPPSWQALSTPLKLNVRENKIFLFNTNWFWKLKQVQSSTVFLASSQFSRSWKESRWGPQYSRKDGN